MDSVHSAATALAAGNLVAFPTETVYGLGADATNPRAVARIFEVKGRPPGHPLIVHIANGSSLESWAQNIPDYAWSLANSLWPGPFTLILRKSDLVSPAVTGGQDTVGIRVPAHPIAQSLLVEFARAGGSGGIAAPSANRFGRVSPTSADAVFSELSDFLLPTDGILDGGDCAIGLESTIIDCTGVAPSIARPGAVTSQMVYSATGMRPVLFTNRVRVSGSLKSHYAPLARVDVAGEAGPGDGFMALSHIPTPAGAVRLLSADSAEQFAHNLYGALRRADELGLLRVVALPPTGEGIAVAVRDRLTRASHRKSASLSDDDR